MLIIIISFFIEILIFTFLYNFMKNKLDSPTIYVLSILLFLLGAEIIGYYYIFESLNDLECLFACMCTLSINFLIATYIDS